MVQDKYPWLLDKYNSFPRNIYRVDTVRYLYLHAFGGVYVDLDMESLKPLDDLMGDHDIILAYLSSDLKFTHNIPNSWFAGKPGHPFWLFCITEVLQADPAATPEDATGPIALRRAVHRYMRIMAPDPQNFHILKPGTPNHWPNDAI